MSCEVPVMHTNTTDWVFNSNSCVRESNRYQKPLVRSALSVFLISIAFPYTWIWIEYSICCVRVHDRYLASVDESTVGITLACSNLCFDERHEPRPINLMTLPLTSPKQNNDTSPSLIYPMRPIKIMYISHQPHPIKIMYASPWPHPIKIICHVPPPHPIKTMYASP